MKYEVAEDCFCEWYLHELNNYPREGLVEKKLKKGDIVVFVNEFTNMYGRYIRVSKGKLDDTKDFRNETYDIPNHKLIPASDA